MSRLTPKDKAIGNNLRLARLAHGSRVTQADIANILGLHRPAVSELEAGRRHLTLVELLTLNDAYGITYEDLTAGIPADR